MKINWIHGLIIIILLSLCLLDMPYWYFTLVRFITAISCTYRWYQAYLEDKTWLIRIFAWIAVLFQPFLKIHLWRIVWNIADILLAIFILFMIIFSYKKTKKE